MKQVLTLLFLIVSLSNLLAQTTTISGKILDVNNNPVVGATVAEKGTTNGTISDVSGAFSLRTQRTNPTLTISAVGFTTQEVQASAGNALNITLAETATSLDAVQVVGSRSLNRSATDTPSPVDIINIRDVTTKTGQLDVNQLLQFVAPSFNSNRQTGSDGADHVDPASLRGLGPDQTLVLINGKRRHQSSLVNLFGTRGRGNTGTDLNAIPATAIERIEILRDGASAQYGSDAIAGVINIVLKSNTNEFTGNINYGAYKASYRFDDKTFDGPNFNVNGNYGFKIAKTGFLNLTADYNFRGHTQRANTGGDLSRRQFGDPEIQNTSVYLNSQIPVSTKAQVYVFGGLNLRKGDAYAWTRFPKTTDDDGNEIDNPRSNPVLYPNGFDPIITSDITDGSLAAGLRAQLGKWNMDVGNVFGSNRFQYGVENTLNASLGQNSPRSFNAGGFQLQQNVTSLNFTRYYDRSFDNMFSGLNLAFGAEFRAENYLIFAGEEGSYRNYDPTATPFRPGGAQGFPGYQPSDEINESRTNLGVYADIEADLTRSFLVGVAARFENYSDFGSTLNGKLSARYKLSPAFTLRGTLSTGFRAPSLAQINFNSTFTNFVNGQPVDVLLARNGSPVTQRLGIPPLKQERSFNASFGLTGRLGSSFSITADAYYIKIRDRVVLTGAFSDDDPDIGADLQALRVGSAQFFTNAITTSTYGLDVILAYGATIGRGRLNTTLAANFNQLDIDEVTTAERLRGKESTYFDERERSFVQASAPPSKINLTFDYSLDRLTFLLRFVRFGEVTLYNYAYEPNVYEPRVTTDVTVGYKLASNVSLSVGSTNIFDVYPNRFDPINTESGGLWDPVQMGSNGAFFFGRLQLRF